MNTHDLGSLRGRVAVVTGSTRGFGRVLVNRLADVGVRVVISGIDLPESLAFAEELTSRGVDAVAAPGDVRLRAEVDGLARIAVDSFGQLDIWVNNAAYETPGMGWTLDFDPETYEKLLRVNTLGTYFGSRAALTTMIARGSGTLVNVTGRGDDLRATKYSNPYGASKAWVRSFTRTLAAEYKDSGVRIIGFNPGLMKTGRVAHAHFIGERTDERTLRMFATVQRVLADPPYVAAERLMEALAQPTTARARTELRLITPVRVAKGLADEAGRRLRREPVK